MIYDTYSSALAHISAGLVPLAGGAAYSLSDYSFQYGYWKNYLTERISRLFEWKDTDNENHHIELPTLIGGISGVKEYEGKITPFFGRYAGDPTVFFDVFKSFSIYSPIESGIYEIGKDIAVIKNNSMGNSILPLVHDYAVKLAHNDVTLIRTLINARESGGTAIGSNEVEIQAIKDYYDDLCQGRYGSILDPAFSGVRFYGESKTTKLEILDLVETHRNILDDFYNDIGIRTSYNKKGNMISEEVSANDSRILFDLDDMFECRKRGAEDVNKLFNKNWTVEKSKEIRYEEMEGGNEDGSEDDDNRGAVETGGAEQ